jgi:hypothetical protein
MHLERINFEATELAPSTIDSQGRYIILDPAGPIAGEATEQGHAQAMLQEMRLFVDDLASNYGLAPGSSWALGKGNDVLGDVLDSRAQNMTQIFRDWSIKSPLALNNILVMAAQLAEQNGLSRNAIFEAYLQSETLQHANVSRVVHYDGFISQAVPSPSHAKVIRLTYGLDPGTIIYPQLDKPGQPAIFTSTEYWPIENPTPQQMANDGRVTSVTADELQRSGAQQILPGYLLAFGVGEPLWHNAPTEIYPANQSAIHQPRHILLMRIFETW